MKSLPNLNKITDTRLIQCGMSRDQHPFMHELYNALLEINNIFPVFGGLCRIIHITMESAVKLRKLAHTYTYIHIEIKGVQP